jgi:hypothetical protein
MAMADCRLEGRARLRLNNDVAAVCGMHGRVSVTVEYDGRQRRAGARADARRRSTQQLSYSTAGQACASPLARFHAEPATALQLE